MRLLGAVVGLIVLAAPHAGVAQQVTPWGDPDLQGVWTNQTPTPLERPAGLAGKEFFTEEEAVEFERTSLTRLLRGIGASGLSEELELSGELTEIWLDTQNGKITPSRRTSLVVDPPDGRLPFTPEGRAQWEAPPSIEQMAAGGQVGASGPEDRPLLERCITAYHLQTPSALYTNYHQVFQTPETVAILSEAMHILRVIPLDGRPHLDSRIGQWEGDARGWWED